MFPQDNAMKLLLLLAFVSLAHGGLLGTKKCTYGPSYWCSHVDHARECSAMQHCISTVWNNQLQGKTGATENCFSVIETLDGVRRGGIPHNMLLAMAASCTKMTGGRRTLCKELLMKNKNEVTLLLQSDLSSAKVATALGLCRNFPDTLPQPQEESAQVAKLTRDICTDCVNFFGDIQEIVNKSEERIAEKVKDTICVKLGYFEELCNKTVDTYTQFLLTFIEQQLNPQDLCYLFHFCGNATHDDFVKAIKAYTAEAKFNSVECIACQDFAKELQSALRNTALQEKILSLLENDVCSRLPGDLPTECKTYVSQYGPLVFQVLVAELDPDTICQTLGFCNGTVEQKQKLTVVSLGEPLTVVRLQEPPKSSQLGFSPQCFLCEEIVRKLVDMGVTNKTEAEIMAALEKVCSLLPSKEGSECDKLVEEYGPEIAKFLQTMAPEAVCTALHLCVLDQLVEVGPAEPVQASDKCQVCELVVTPIRDYLNNPAHEATIKQFMGRVCDLLPASDKNMCLEMIDMYESLFLHFVNEYDDPVKVCTTLHLCTAKQVEEGNESGHPLTFVPMVKLLPAMPRMP